MSNLAKQLLPVRVFAKIAVKRALRDKTAIFFLFAFPLIFLFVFGGIFGKNNGLSFKVALINQSNTQYAQSITKQLSQQKILKLSSDVTTLKEAQDKMGRGQLDAAIVLPANFGQQTGQQPSGQAVVYYTNNSQQASQALVPVLQAAFEGMNSRFVSLKVPFTVTSKELNTKNLTQFDYTFAGLLGFSIIGIGIFGPVNVFPELKKQGVLRRLHTTPLRVWQYFLANAVSQSIVGLLATILMFAVAMAVFHLQVVGNFVALGLFIIVSITMILGIGLAIGGWAKNEQQAAPLANIVIFPMMFLSGTFFPRFLMPEWLQHVSAFLPLTPVIDGIRLIATEGKSLIAIGPQVGMVLGWMVVIYVIAFLAFRWE